jgi:hypothetical protein
LLIYVVSDFDCQAIEKGELPTTANSPNRYLILSNQTATECSPVAVLKNISFETNLQDKNYLVGIK